MSKRVQKRIKLNISEILLFDGFTYTSPKFGCKFAAKKYSNSSNKRIVGYFDTLQEAKRGKKDKLYYPFANLLKLL